MAEKWSIKIRLEYLTGRSLLNRTSEGNCKFAHRSIMEYFVVEHIFVSAPGYSLELTDQMQRFLFEKLGIYFPADARFADENRCKVEVIEPEVRAGYPTNLGIFNVGDREVSAASVYGIEIALLDMSGKVTQLGEHLQAMMVKGASAKRFSDIRVSLEKFGRSDEWAVAFLSVWLIDSVVLSKVKVRVVDWLAAMSSAWADRRTTSLVGKLVSPGVGIESVVWFPATRLDTLDANLSFDSAGGCPFVSVGFCQENKVAVIRLIAAIRDPGPLAPFGILSGGSMIPVDGRACTVLNSPVRHLGEIGKVIEQEVAASPVADRWPNRTSEMVSARKAGQSV